MKYYLDLTEHVFWVIQQLVTAYLGLDQLIKHMLIL